jgi:hypothetical protein
MRRVIVGMSGGCTSARCGGWALENFPKDEVIFLFHDTKEEDPDTYRFLREICAKLNHPITEYSDGRSVTELFDDENMLANDQFAFCSRILKAEQGERCIADLRTQGVDEIIKVVGFSANEWERVQRSWAHAQRLGYSVRFPIIENGWTKQNCADWCNCTMGVTLPAMYEWSDHANCVGCVRGGKAYWLAVHQNRPDVFWQRVALEDKFQHTFMNRYSLRDALAEGLKRKVNRKEAITIGPCECGD